MIQVNKISDTELEIVTEHRIRVSKEHLEAQLLETQALLAKFKESG